jgi:glycosyltransferase involved in cell wall biosynthesis
MAAGLPCVASPVGANCDVVLNGRTGYLASDTREWIDAMEKMLRLSDERVDQMGASGRMHALQHYSTEVIYGRLAELLEKTVMEN